MSSSIFYRFKSQKDYSRISFDAAQLGLTVFDVKRDIIQIEKLGTGADFDLLVSNADSGKEYHDDAENIPRGTSIIVQRKPPSRGPGKGSASRYVTSNAVQVTSRQEFKKPMPAHSTTPRVIAAPPASSDNPEDDAIRNMLLASSDQWQETQDRMAMSKPVYRPGVKGMPSGPIPDRPLPQGYICYRCGQKGHYIQACPTNGDESFENRKRIKRTTGIPRSQLQKVDNPADDVDGNLMVNAEGESVMFVPDAAAWDSYKKSTKSAKQEELPEDSELACGICKTILIQPQSVPCCHEMFCEECIQGALLESDFICPKCGTKDILLDKLKPCPELHDKIQAYLSVRETQPQEAHSTSSAVNLLKRPLDQVEASESLPTNVAESHIPFPMPPFDPIMMGMMGFPNMGYPAMPLPGFGFPPMLPPVPLQPPTYDATNNNGRNQSRITNQKRPTRMP